MESDRHRRGHPPPSEARPEKRRRRDRDDPMEQEERLSQSAVVGFYAVLVAVAWFWLRFGSGLYGFCLFPTGFVLVEIAVLIGLFAGRKEKKRQAKERIQYSHRKRSRKS